MSAEYRFVFPLPAGLHARPACALAEIANTFVADIHLVNERTHADVDAKSMLSMIGADIRENDACRLYVTGADEAAAHAALREFIDLVLPNEEPFLTAGSQAGSATLPRCLDSDTPFFPGTVVHHGVGQGSLVFLGGLSLPATVDQFAAADKSQEGDALAQAVSTLRVQMERQLTGQMSAAADILRAHLSVLNDRTFLEKLQEGIRKGSTAGQAVLDAGRFFMNLLAAGSGFIRERAVDLQEVCLQLLHALYGEDDMSPVVQLTEPSIVVAEQLGPRQLMDLNCSFLKGLVIGEMSTTSHAAILARAFDIPTLSGISVANLCAGRQVVVDAQSGILIPSLNDNVIRYYRKETAARNRRAERLALNASTPAVTADGLRLEVAVNISTAEEVDRAVVLGAEGVGLFRTEMLYLSSDEAPSEEIQVEIYRKALRHAAGRTVIVRTFDIGGDKPVPYLNFPEEENPFLGYRGVRIYRDHLILFETQLRAVIRASASGKIRLMIPMVSTVEEIRWVKDRIALIHETFKSEGILFDPDMEIGVMVETPSAAFSIRALSAEADFFSIGTNDLSQYFFAADRTNARVSGLCRVRHPAFLRVLSHAVSEARTCGRWVGLCGEMAGDPRNLPLLVGLGLNEISTGPAEIPRLKQRMPALSAETCREWLEKSMIYSTADEVDTFLSQVSAALEERLLEPGLIVLDSDSETKEEAVRELVNALYVSGRTDDRSAVEEAIWAREAMGVTGVGFGFGVPHCKSDAMLTHSIGISRFRKPVPWNPEEEEPVRMIILLALRQSGSDALHMKIFSKLARKLMHEDFRRELLGFRSGPEVVSFLEKELGL